MGVASFELPVSAQKPGEHVLSVLVRNNGHNWNLEADDYHKEGRGLFHVDVSRKTRESFAVPISWKIQGNLGGEDIQDPVRGVANHGGLYGERHNWHLPAFDASNWSSIRPDDHAFEPGVTWLRADFDLDLPLDLDVTLGLEFGTPDNVRSEKEYRALIFVNGWNMGQYIAHVGPQKQFVLPRGILQHNGANTIALAVTVGDGVKTGIEPATLRVLRQVRYPGADLR
jgi:beta-galactosidase GanA